MQLKKAMTKLEKKIRKRPDNIKLRYRSNFVVCRENIGYGQVNWTYAIHEYEKNVDVILSSLRFISYR